MIEPLLTGEALLEDISSVPVEPGSLALWRLGQAGVVCVFPGGRTVVFDPYLSNHCEAVLPAPLDHRRATRAPLDGSELGFADVLVCSHDHLDHLDAPTIRSAARLEPQPWLVAPRPVGAALTALGWGSDRLRLTEDGQDLDVAGLRGGAFAVPHEDFGLGEKGNPYQGYVLGDGDVSVAHLGDALDHPRVRESLSRLAPDVLLVPINGRSPERAALGFAGNMSAAEAVDLALSLPGTAVVPMHYDMFDQNVDAGAASTFATLAAEANLPHRILRVGQQTIFSAAERTFS